MTTNYNWHIKSFGLLICLIVAVNAIRVQQQPIQPQAKVPRGE